MSADAKRVQSVFLVAVEIADAASRVAVLDRECMDDPALRRRVEALLQAHAAPASILAQSVGSPIDGESARAFGASSAPTSEDAPGQVATERAGAVIGAYKLL